MTISLSQRITPEHVAFWQFSGQVYAQPGVADQLLAAQTHLQIWVNDWLFVLWQAQYQRILKPTFQQQLQQQHRWRQRVIVPWRTARQQAKNGSTECYRRLLSSELALEWCDQMTLAHCALKLTQPSLQQQPIDCMYQGIHCISTPTPAAASALIPVLTKAFITVTKLA